MVGIEAKETYSIIAETFNECRGPIIPAVLKLCSDSKEILITAVIYMKKH